MPTKVVVNAMYSEPISGSAGVRNSERMATMYFSNEWDQYYHEIFYSVAEKKAAYEKLQVDLILALNAIIYLNAETDRSAVSSQVNVMNTLCYIHRVALDRSSAAPVYQVIYYHQGDPETASCCSIAQNHIDQLREKSVTVLPCFYNESDDFEHVFASEVVRVAPKLWQLEQTLQQKIYEADASAFLNFFDKQTSGLRITQRLRLPVQQMSGIRKVLLYEALLPKVYPYFNICICQFTILASRFEEVREAFHRALVVQVIDRTSMDYCAFLEAHAWFTSALQPLQAMQGCLGNVSFQKSQTKAYLSLLKERLIWVIQEAARQYYLDICREALESANFSANKAKVLKAINKQFLNVVHISHLFRLSFVDLHGLDIEPLFALYHQLLTRAYSKNVWSSRAYGYLNTNMHVVYQESVAQHKVLFTVNLKGICTLKPELFEWLSKQHEAVIKHYYLAETDALLKNFNAFNEFINLNDCLHQEESAGTRYIHERIEAVIQKLKQYEKVVASYAQVLDVTGVEVVAEHKEEFKTQSPAPLPNRQPPVLSSPSPAVVLHKPAFASSMARGRGIESERMLLSETVPSPTPSLRLVKKLVTIPASAALPAVLSSVSPSPVPQPMPIKPSVGHEFEAILSPNVSQSYASLDSSLENVGLVDVEEIEREARLHEVVKLIETISYENCWWHAQLKGGGGDKVLGADKVPRGIGRMLKIIAMKNADGTNLTTLQRLTAYQLIAQKRLQSCNWANFFHTRSEQSTQRFYRYLTQMNGTIELQRGQARLSNFWTMLQAMQVVNASESAPLMASSREPLLRG